MPKQATNTIRQEQQLRQNSEPHWDDCLCHPLVPTQGLSHPARVRLDSGPSHYPHNTGLSFRRNENESLQLETWEGKKYRVLKNPAPAHNRDVLRRVSRCKDLGNESRSRNFVMKRNNSHYQLPSFSGGPARNFRPRSNRESSRTVENFPQLFSEMATSPPEGFSVS